MDLLLNGQITLYQSNSTGFQQEYNWDYLVQVARL